MRATVWSGRNKVAGRERPRPEDPQRARRDREDHARPRSAARTCTSTTATSRRCSKGDILGHEFMGEVVEVGRGVTNLKVGDRVVVPFPIACGTCYACAARAVLAVRELQPERLDGREAVGPLAGRHLRLLAPAPAATPAGRPSTRACRSPTSGRSRSESDLTDEQVLFLSDIFPTGYMGAEMCDIKPGDIVAVWGCGPVGQFAIASAYLLGAERVIAIDRFPYRLQMAREQGRRRDDQLRADVDVREALQRADRRPRPGRLHRRRRHGGPPPPRRHVRLRPRQAGDAAGDRARLRAARGDHRLPQRRHRLGHRRLRRVHRQVPDRRGDEPVADDQDRPVPRAPLHAPAAASASRTARSTRASSSPTACRSTRRRTATRCSSTSRTSA